MESSKQSADKENIGSTTRRRFLHSTTATVASGMFAAKGLSTAAGERLQTSTLNATRPNPVEELLRNAVMPKEAIERFLDPDAQVWARFHPTYGYLLRDSFMRDGVDGSHTLARYAERGHRRQVNFADLPCRINTYGDSFTQGHQVGDGETWQEVLSAHFCEPIRNYGIGGFGVYQAYRRLLEIEETSQGASHVILNIWGDDHHRSIMACRWLSFPPDFLTSMSGEMFHANPWAHARLDPQSGDLIEVENACPTPETLYRMCDPEFVVETFRNDPITHAYAAMRTGKVTDPKPLESMAAAIDFEDLDFASEDSVRTSVTRLHAQYAVRVGMRVVEKLNRYLKSHSKKLLVLLSHPSGSVWHHCAGKTQNNPHFVDWHPAEFREFLSQADIPYVNTVDKHVEEFQQFRIDAKAYVDRYYIGHYNPQGNHFFAFSIKDALRSWLEPLPPAYRESAQSPVDFEGYLPG